MQKDLETLELMQDIAKKGLHILANFNQPNFFTNSFKEYTNFTNDYFKVLSTLINNPEKISQIQSGYYKDAINLLHNQYTHWLCGKNLPLTDPRFTSDEWIKNPFFNMLSQQYLLACEHAEVLLEQLNYEDIQLQKRTKFFINQYLEALSPKNFLHTNPELIAETIKSNGKNLLTGLNHFLNDINSSQASLILKITDTEVFKVGENLATSKGRVIFKNDLIELIQYEARTKEVYSVPLLLIPPWINKYYILDLNQNNSFVNWLLQQGITVFMISWVNPDEKHANKGIYDYLKQGPIAAINIIKEQLNVTEVNTLGFCIGGTLLAILLGFLKGKERKVIRCASFLATLIDFSDPGDISVFIDEQQVKILEEKMQKKGYLEGQFMTNAFNSLRARDLIWSYFVKHYLRGEPHVPFDILYWNADNTNMPLKMHSEYLRWLYLKNHLIKPNKIKLNKVPVNINNINTPVFFIATQKDHIAPWKTVYNGFKIFKGHSKFILGGSGHIAGIINPPNSKKYGYYYNATNPTSAQSWFEGSKHYSGSWWTKWFRWLERKSGELQKAPGFENLKYKGIVEAPGNYVHIKSEKGENL